MKTIRTLLIALVALTACTADEATNPTVGNPADTVGITTTVATTVVAGTRADATDVAAYQPATGTELTLFYGDMNAPVAADATATYTYTDGTPGTPGTAGTWTTNSPIYWNNLTAMNTAATGEAETMGYPFFAAAPAVPVATPAVIADQNIEANYTASDLLIAYTATTQRRTDVALTMRHVLSQITVSIDAATTDGTTPDISGVGAATLTIDGAKTAYTLAYNKDTEKPAVATADANATATTITPLRTTAEVATATTSSFAAIVPTQTFAAGALTLTFTIKGKSYTWTNKEEITLATGTRTHISLIAAISSVEMKEVSVAPWTDAAGTTTGSIDTDDVLTAGTIKGITEKGVLNVFVYKADGTDTGVYGKYPISYTANDDPTKPSTAAFDKSTNYSPIKWEALPDKEATYTYTASFFSDAAPDYNHNKDLLGGVSATATPWGTRPSFVLSHLVSRLVVKLSCTDGTYDADAINKATITVQRNKKAELVSSTATKVKAEIDDLESPDEATVTLLKEADATDATDVAATPATFYAILCPQTLMDDGTTAPVPDTDVLTLTILPTGNPVGGKKTYTMKTPVSLEAGKTFTLNATLSASSLVPGSITVNSWDTTTSGSGNLEIQ